jgi:hypothetical protein
MQGQKLARNLMKEEITNQRSHEGARGLKKLPGTNTSLSSVTTGEYDNVQVTSTSNFFTNAYDWGADDVGPKTTTSKTLVKKIKQSKKDIKVCRTSWS